MNINRNVKGLYLHFKGNLYYVHGISHDCSMDKYYVRYSRAMRPNDGEFVREYNDFFSSDGIADRPDNKTGQACRFRKISIGDLFFNSVEVG